MIDFNMLRGFLDDQRLANFEKVLNELAEAVQNRRVPNSLLENSKFYLNRYVERSVEAYDNTYGRHAYNTLVMGTHNIPPAIKEMDKVGDKNRADFLRNLLPIKQLMDNAKPFIVKRAQILAEEKAAKEAADAKAGIFKMHCQCCARPIFAETGVIAHHGYERPGFGYQTASCIGARELPFEVSRDALGHQINVLKSNLANLEKVLKVVQNEKQPIRREYKKEFEGVTVTIDWTRENFDSEMSKLEKFHRWSVPANFDEVKKSEIHQIETRIAGTKDHIKWSEDRYNSWKQTHKREGDKWVCV